MEKFNTSNAPEAIWPYNQCVKANWFYFLSWQIALDPSSMQIISDDIQSQTHQVCKNIISVLESIGLDIENTVKITIYLKNIKDFPLVNEIYGSYFHHHPARTCIEVSSLPKDSLIEIEAIAVE